MSDRTRLALATAGAGLVLGVLGDVLFRAPAGINVMLWVTGILAAAALLRRRFALPLDEEARWLVVPALYFAAAFAWRDAPTLKAVSLLALLLTAALVPAVGGSLRTSGIIDLALRACTGGLAVLFGPMLLASRDVAWQEIPLGQRWRFAAAVLRGLVLAIPLLLVFGGLFLSADAGFRRIVESVLNVGLPQLLSHVLVAALWGWLAIGLLRAARRTDTIALPRIEAPAGLGLGIVEVGTALAALDALFLTFVVVQFRYLFGGAAVVERTLGLTYADYARRGFFELAAAAALALPVLLAADAFLKREGNRDEGVFRGLAGTLVALVYVIMGSAVYRMALYQQAYGLTELRLLVMVFMAWLAAVFAWFGATVLRGRRERFVAGALAAGYLAAAALVAINPHAMIARTNLAHLEATGRFDAYYASTLSADAAPVLAAALPRLPEEDRRLLAETLLLRWGDERDPDWRSWNWARLRARQAVEARRPEVERMAGP